MRIIGLTLLLIIFISCKENNKERVTRIVSEWQGKEIIFPKNLIFTRFGKDTTNYHIPQSKYKILVYVDSSGCTSCKLKLEEWNNFIQFVDSISKDNIPFLFFFHPKSEKSEKSIQSILQIKKLDIPICIDPNDRLNLLNKFPIDITFQSFLLNENNKVVIIGNPIYSYAIKQLYIREITGNKSTNKSIPKTIVEIDKKTIELGCFNKGEIQKSIIKIKNIGENPLVIIAANSTCSCISVSYNKNSIIKGEYTIINIEIKTDKIGYFKDWITIQSNIDEQIKISVSGHVH